MHRTVALLVLALAAQPAAADRLRVDPDAGNNTISAIFDATFGERITAMSSSVACDVDLDRAAGVANGTCTVPLTSIKVDNEPTKTEHFQEWATNKKTKAKACALEAKLQGVHLGQLRPKQPAEFSAEVPFTVCGRGRADGGKEKFTGTAVLLPAGSYGDLETVRVRGKVEGFNRDAYHIGPKYTEGWLARVQSLAKVVAEDGAIEITIFAKPAPTAGLARKAK